jgi:predicted transcriptional regulator
MTDLSIVVQTLRELGITRTEAEVYLATLREAGGGPVSGYRVAQSVGKDPANLSKTLASLEKLGAVRTIQDKPRLYIPVPPSDFTDKLLADMKSNQTNVLQQLADWDISTPKGVPMPLQDQQQTLQKAAQLLTRCRRELLLFADKQMLEKLGTSLEALAASSEVSVNILSLEKLGWAGIEEKVIDLPVGFADPHPVPWLQMVLDRQTWLIASFPSAGTDKLPSGWWSDDPSLALVMGAGLAAAMKNDVEVSFEIPPVQTVVPEPESELQKDLEQVVEEPVLEPEPAKTEEAETAPAIGTEPLEDNDVEEGIQFIIRHDGDGDDLETEKENNPEE